MSPPAGQERVGSPDGSARIGPERDPAGAGMPRWVKVVVVVALVALVVVAVVLVAGGGPGGHGPGRHGAASVELSEWRLAALGVSGWR